MRLELDTNTTTATTQPDVVMPRALAEWFGALLESFPELVRRFDAPSNQEGEG